MKIQNLTQKIYKLSKYLSLAATIKQNRVLRNYYTLKRDFILDFHFIIWRKSNNGIESHGRNENEINKFNDFYFSCSFIRTDSKIIFVINLDDIKFNELLFNDLM